tara:strand:+ start:249 stop:386 length:138 start_codon:yes stop_codon:yes gene_type:complete
MTLNQNHLEYIWSQDEFQDLMEGLSLLMSQIKDLIERVEYLEKRV